MNEKRFLIGDKACELMTSVLDITTSKSHYPVRFRRLSDRLQECAIDIYCFSEDANGVKTDTQKRVEARYDLQTKVISCCNKFQKLAEYSLHAKLIGGTTCDKWSSLATDIKYMTLAARSKLT